MIRRERRAPQAIALRYFQLELPDRSVSPHVGQGLRENLSAYLTISGEDDLLEVMRQLGVSLRPATPGAPRPVPGQPYPFVEYARFENLPIDIGILEKADNVEVIPASFVWDDVGSWLAVDRLNPRDEHGNVVRGLHAGVDTADCIVMGAPDHVVATIGVEGLIIVHTPDATLICPKSRAEEVRGIVRDLDERGLGDWL